MTDLWRHRCLYALQWGSAGDLLDTMAAQIMLEFKPSAVVGIARGGLVPATHLANALGATQFGVMGVTRNTSDAKYSAKDAPRLLWRSFGANSYKGMRVLLVDDVIGEGETLAFARRVLAETGAAEVRTAALVRMARSSFAADYVGLVLDDWVVFPWERAGDGSIAVEPI